MSDTLQGKNADMPSIDCAGAGVIFKAQVHTTDSNCGKQPVHQEKGPSIQNLKMNTILNKSTPK